MNFECGTVLDVRWVATSFWTFGPVGKYAELENRDESGSQTLFECKLKVQYSVLNPILEGTALEVKMSYNKQFSQ